MGIKKETGVNSPSFEGRGPPEVMMKLKAFGLKHTLKNRREGFYLSRMTCLVLVLMLFPGFSAWAKSPVPDYNSGLKHYTAGEYEQALPFFREAAELELKEAQYQLCIMYKRGQGMPRPNVETGYSWCKKAADQSHAGATYEVGASLAEGLGTEKDIAKAVTYYMKASKEGVPEAQYAVGRLYEFGEGGLTQNWYQARMLYMWSSGKGFAPATYRVGVMFEYGKGIRPSMAAARRWYTKAAAMGNEEAKEKLRSLDEVSVQPARSED